MGYYEVSGSGLVSDGNDKSDDIMKRWTGPGPAPSSSGSGGGFLSNILGAAVDAAKGVASSVFGGSGSQTPTYVPPAQKDNTMKYVLLGGLAIGAVYLLKKKKVI